MAQPSKRRGLYITYKGKNLSHTELDPAVYVDSTYLDVVQSLPGTVVIRGPNRRERMMATIEERWDTFRDWLHRRLFPDHADYDDWEWD